MQRHETLKSKSWRDLNIREKSKSDFDFSRMRVTPAALKTTKKECTKI